MHISNSFFEHYISHNPLPQLNEHNSLLRHEVKFFHSNSGSDCLSTCLVRVTYKNCRF